MINLQETKYFYIYFDLFNLQPSLYYKKSSLSQINALDFTNEIAYLSCKIFRQLVTKNKADRLHTVISISNKDSIHSTSVRKI